MTAAPPPPPTQTPPNHSEIFEKFVNPSVDDDSINVAGMVAYALYKKDKRQWMMRFCATNNREPRPDEIVNNYLLGWNEARIEASRTMARTVLQNFAAFVVNQERPKIVKEALRGTLVSNLLMGLVVNATYTAVLALIVVVLGAQGVDLFELYEKLKPAR